MDFTLSSSAPSTTETGLLVVGAFTDGALPKVSQAIDRSTRGKLSAAIERGDLESKPGSTLLLPGNNGTPAERILLVSLGVHKGFDEHAYRQALHGTAKALLTSSAKEALVTLAEVEVDNRTTAWRTHEVALHLANGMYRFDAFVPPQKPRGVQNVKVHAEDAKDGLVKRALLEGLAIAEGLALTRDLGNLPGNVCHPVYLAEKAVALGEEFNLEVDILERADMELLGMGSALSVGQASAVPCKFIVMRHNGGGEKKPVVLVGKGVTFDTGGISLKPGAGMDEMKFDMCGAAAVFGAMKTAGRLNLPLNVIGIVPAVENMPGSNASRPGDVVKSMAGLTIEILNTDAEGRLILCDALTYAERYQPECVIDIATLTGACVVALGNVTSGLFANDDALAQDLLACGNDTGDRAWRMPLYADYLKQLDSNFADISNLGGKEAGAVTAACFLGKFTQNYRWAHIDIAGTAALTGKDKGATGRPVQLLSEFLLRRANVRARS